MNPADKLRNETISIISKAAKLTKEEAGNLLEKPPEGIDADIAFPCFVLARKLKADPKEIAETIGKKLKPKGLIGEIEIAGPYVNLYADWDKVGDLVLKSILREKNRYGSGKKTKRRILIEHTSANPDGPIHLGHLRNMIIGDSLAKIMHFSGNSVRTESWLNDTGRQIAIAVMEYMLTKHRKPAKKKPDWWVLDLYLKGNKRLEADPSLEEDIKDIIRRFETGDKKLKGVFSRIVDECIKGHKQTMENLGIKIDNFFKESISLSSGSVNRILKKVEKLPEGRVDGKRIWVDLKKFNIEREFTLTREDGTTIYPARDLAFHEHKFSKADYNLNVIGTDQKFYFKQLNSALNLLFPKKTKNYHVVFYEFLLLPEGTMSTRAGRFVSMDDFIRDVLKEARKTVNKKMPRYPKKLKEKIAETVGIGALKYAMVKVSPEKTYSFSVKDTLNFEGDTAPYIQYTYARACSILRKGRIKNIGKFNAGLLKDKKEQSLLKALMNFPETVKDASRDYRPHYIANYASNLATLFNEFYQSLPVLKSEEETKKARLALVKATQNVLKNALSLLGINAPEVM